MAKTVIDELITLITLKTSRDSESNLKNFKDGIGSVRKVALKTGAVLTGLATAIGIMVSKTERSIANQARFAKSIGVSFESLQGLQFAAKQVGASADDINQSLSSLSEAMSPTEPGKYNDALLQLNVRIKDANKNLRPVSAVLLDISKRFQGLAAQQQINLGKRLGLTPGTIRLLQEGPLAIKEAMIRAKAVGGVIPEGAVKQAIEYDKSLSQLKTTLSGFFKILIIQLAPAIEKIINGIEDLITHHGRLLIILTKVAAGVAAFVAVMKVLRIIFMAVSTLASIVGPVLEGLGVVFAALDPEVVALVAAIALFIKLLPKITKFAKEAGSAIKAFFSPAIQAMKKDIESVEKVFSKVKGFFKRGGAKPALTNVATANRAATIQTIPVPKSGTTTNTNNTSNVNSGKTTNNVTIHVNGSQNPNKVAQEVKRQFDLSTALQVASPGFNRPAVA